MDIFVGFLVNGDDVCIATVSCLDLSSSAFAFHGCLYQTKSWIDEEDEMGEVCIPYRSHVLQWGTMPWALGRGILTWRWAVAGLIYNAMHIGRFQCWG